MSTSDKMTFEQLASLFADGLFAKSRLEATGGLTPFQRARLNDSINIDIRKLGDMAFPAARRPLISTAAQGAADAMAVDLCELTWHAQKKVDGYKSFTYEHFFPVKEIRLALVEAASKEATLRTLERMLWVAWITKDEDKRLREAGFGSRRPDPWLAYETVGIKIVSRPDNPQPAIPTP